MSTIPCGHEHEADVVEDGDVAAVDTVRGGEPSQPAASDETTVATAKPTASVVRHV
jgi:hypothetical protein